MGDIPASGSIRLPSGLGIIYRILFQGSNNLVTFSYMTTSETVGSSTTLATSFHDDTRYLIE